MKNMSSTENQSSAHFRPIFYFELKLKRPRAELKILQLGSGSSLVNSFIQFLIIVQFFQKLSQYAPSSIIWKEKLYPAGKVQLISLILKHFFMAFNTPKKQQNFSHCFTLFSKMGQINKIQALYYHKYTLITY